MKSKKHAASKEKAKAEKTCEQCLTQTLAKRMAGKTLPTKRRAYRMKVVQSFLREGIPLSKVDGLRGLVVCNCMVPGSALGGILAFLLLCAGLPSNVI